MNLSDFIIYVIIAACLLLCLCKRNGGDATPICIGYKTGSQITRTQCQILIGDNVQSDKDYELAIGVGDYELRTVMTPNEWKVVDQVIRRAIREKIAREGYPKHYVETGKNGSTFHMEGYEEIPCPDHIPGCTLHHLKPVDQ